MLSTKRKSDETRKGADRPTDPIELLSRVRGKVANDIRPNKRGNAVSNDDVQQNIREIRAILITNAEIFDRCMKSREKSSSSKITSSDDTSLDDSSSGDSSSKVKFVRYSFDHVWVKFDTKDNYSGKCIADKKRLVKSFDMTPLTQLPDGIANIIFMPPKKSGNDFIDYEEFFEKSLILHEDVLGTFLEQLKNHLISSVQVLLGEIETWLMEPASNMNYLQSKFRMKIVKPGDKILLKEFTATRATLPRGMINLNFNISKESDRRRLEKVLELIEINDDDDDNDDDYNDDYDDDDDDNDNDNDNDNNDDDGDDVW